MNHAHILTIPVLLAALLSSPLTAQRHGHYPRSYAPQHHAPVYYVVPHHHHVHHAVVQPRIVVPYYDYNRRCGW